MDFRLFDELRLFKSRVEHRFFVQAPANEAFTLDIQENEEPQVIETARVAHLFDDDSEKRIFGVVGVIKLLSGPYLVVVTRVAPVASIQPDDHHIYKVTEAEVLPFGSVALLTDQQKAWEERFRQMVAFVMRTDGLYYSTSFDLTHSLQRIQATAPDFRAQPMISRADDRFLWNAHLLKWFQGKALETGRYLLPLVCGFVGQKLFADGLRLLVVSRRSRHRVGTRFYRRGVDESGHSANFVETEQMLIHRGDMAAIVQTRGSIPIRWSQNPNLRWQPQPLVDDREREQNDAMARHCAEHGAVYGRTTLVNLINQRGREALVGSRFLAAFKMADAADTRVVSFSFHDKAGRDWTGLDSLFELINADLDEFRFFACQGGWTQSEQLGVFRSNCMDSLDRTNCVQRMIAEKSLLRQLESMNVELQGDARANLLREFKNLWADNGDALSVQYAGTGALKADFTRTGVRTLRGQLMDGYNAVTRWRQNNFSDGWRQDALDLFTGAYTVDAANLPGPVDDSLLRARDWRAACVAAFVLLPLLIVLNCLIWSEVVNYSNFTLVLVFAAVVAFIFQNGLEFVDKPKLKRE